MSNISETLIKELEELKDKDKKTAEEMLKKIIHK